MLTHIHYNTNFEFCTITFLFFSFFTHKKICTSKSVQLLGCISKSIPIRVTEKELKEIDEAAKKAKKNRTEYLISAALGKEITVIEDLREMIVQLKKIGNNLNQLTRKANAHEVEVVNLTETNNAMGDIYQALFLLARKADN